MKKFRSAVRAKKRLKLGSKQSCHAHFKNYLLTMTAHVKPHCQESSRCSHAFELQNCRVAEHYPSQFFNNITRYLFLEKYHWNLHHLESLIRETFVHEQSLCGEQRERKRKRWRKFERNQDVEKHVQILVIARGFNSFRDIQKCLLPQETYLQHPSTSPPNRSGHPATPPVLA